LRRLAPTLTDAGLTTKALVRASRLMRRLDDGLSATLTRACKDRWHLAADGHVAADGDLFAGLPPVMGRRLLADLLGLVGGEIYPPGGGGRGGERLRRRLAEGGRGGTLAGCRIWRSRGRWLIARELRAAARSRVKIHPGETVLWDRRFFVHLPDSAGWRAGLGIAPLAARSPLEAALPCFSAGGLVVGRPAIVAPGAAPPDGPWAVHIGRARAEGALCALWRRQAPPQGCHIIATTVS
jgi:hypothetical protein